MTNLNTHLPLEDIKKSEKLMGIDCKKYWSCDKAFHEDHMFVISDNIGEYSYGFSAPTIADILNNAESIFPCFIEFRGDNLSICAKSKQISILKMCQQYKTIETIDI